ncbi:MAG: hypothetical protein ACK47B_27660 [Armatimonadota bacterium]
MRAEIERRLRDALSDPLSPEELAEIAERVGFLRQQAARLCELPLREVDPAFGPVEAGRE